MCIQNLLHNAKQEPILYHACTCDAFVKVQFSCGYSSYQRKHKTELFYQNLNPLTIDELGGGGVGGEEGGAALYSWHCLHVQKR